MIGPRDPSQPVTPELIAEWRTLERVGMTSAVGEYTPEEFWWVLDQLEATELALRNLLDAVHAGRFTVLDKASAGYCASVVEAGEAVVMVKRKPKRK